MGESRLGLLIASPPCQAWSMAGKREGLKDQARVLNLCSTWAADPSAPRPGGWHDERSPLVAEPMRWASALRPALMAWEQVPPVLDLWSHCARLLGVMGYSTWTGILSAERYGVPQTRKRAILMASLLGPVAPPRPTHQRYIPKPKREEATDAMFAAPEVERIVHPEDRELLPWVLMADALTGDLWPAIPAPTVTAGGGSSGGPEPFGRGGRQRISRAIAEPTIGSVGAARGRDVWLRKRDVRDERKAAGAGNQPRRADAPAPTIDTGIRQAEWSAERPATTVIADPRIARPGHKGDISQMDNAVRVSVAEASILQSFPPDYPWRGSRTAQFRQIGNAVPPLLARAILESLTEGSDIGSDCIDLFAGPGGWDCGAQSLGIDPLGIELDPDACETREAAGLRTLCGDVAQLDPASFADVAMEAA